MAVQLVKKWGNIPAVLKGTDTMTEMAKIRAKIKSRLKLA